MVERTLATFSARKKRLKRFEVDSRALGFTAAAKQFVTGVIKLNVFRSVVLFIVCDLFHVGGQLVTKHRI